MVARNFILLTIYVFSGNNTDIIDVDGFSASVSTGRGFRYMALVYKLDWWLLVSK